MAEWRVLVVDDDTHMLDLMTRRLGRLGLQADRAQDGSTAISLLDKTAYDLILTDIYMPGGTGLDILRKAKENDPHVQVIVVTGSATLDNAVEALNMGAFSYLSKPFDHMSVFDNAVARALEFRRLIRDNQRLGEIQRRRGDMLEEEVTDRIRQMRRKQQGMIDLLAKLPEGVLVVDTEGRILLSNALAEEWLAREARLEEQPLRRYLSTLTPPRRPTRSETEIDGVFLRLTAQPLPPEEGRPRTLVTIGEAGGEGGDVRRQLAASLKGLRPGLDWLARQTLDEKEKEVVRVLLTQVAAIEGMLKAEGGEVPQAIAEVDWAAMALEEKSSAEAEPSPAAAAEATRGEGRPTEREGQPKPQWPPPRASSETAAKGPRVARLDRRERPKRTPEEEKFGTVILNEEGTEAEAPQRPAAAALVSEPLEAEPESISLEAGLSRLLEHLAETPSIGQKAQPLAADLEDVAAREAGPPQAAPEPPAEKEVEAAPPKLASGLLKKIRREAKPVAPEREAGEVPPGPKKGTGEIASPVAELADKPLPGTAAGARRKSGPFAREVPPRPKKGTGEVVEPVIKAGDETIAEGAAAPRRKSGPLGREGPSGLLRKVRSSQKQAAGTGPPVEVEPAIEAHRTEPAQPVDARAGEPEEQDISRLLEAVREAAEGTGTSEPPTSEAAPAQPHEDEAPPTPTPSSTRRQPIWPPPLPSESDEE